MPPSAEPALALVRRRDRLPDSLDYRRVRAALAAEKVVRVSPGVFAPSAEWSALTPIQRHRFRVSEAAERVRGVVIFSHFAAAALHDMDILGSWPEKVDVRVERSGGGRSTGLIRRRSLGTEGIGIQPWGNHFVTTPAQTAVDLAAVLGHTAAVVTVDQALWRQREGGALATLEELHGALAPRCGLHGAARAERAVAFATDLSDSVRESQSRVFIHRLGFPAPILQHPILLPSGRMAYPDFYFEEHEHAGEFDGLGKYADPEMLQGKTPEEALIAEKDRGDELRRVVKALSRWRTPALREPRLLYDILRADGLPSTRPRPPLGLRWP